MLVKGTSMCHLRCLPLCRSDTDREQSRINKEIDKYLRQEKKLLKSEIKLLLLGTGESGKSTFVKQMRIIHGTEYTDKEKRQFAVIVYRTIFAIVRIIVDAMDLLNVPYEDPVAGRRKADLIRSVDPARITSLSSPFVEAIEELWADRGIRECFRRRREYRLHDSARYFLDDLDRFKSADYSPSNQDILRVRVPTSGINEYFFHNKEHVFRIVDVGGQRSERKKWIHCFEQVTSLIFLAALSDYDQVLSETEFEVNRMEESRSLFGVIITSCWFRESSTMLFMNKKDLLEEKIAESHLADYFPRFEGPRGDAIAARDFIMAMFLEMNPNRKRIVYPHFTCATDTQNVRFVFEVVRDSVLSVNLKEHHLI